MMQIGMSHEVGAIVARRIALDYSPQFDNCMGVFRDGVCLGGVLFKDYTGTNVTVHWSGVDGENWITRQLLGSIADYVFNQLGCIRITAEERSSDEYLNGLVRKMGFQLEATVHNFYPDGDKLIYVMTRDTCPWLKLGERYGRERRGRRLS